VLGDRTSTTISGAGTVTASSVSAWPKWTTASGLVRRVFVDLRRHAVRQRFARQARRSDAVTTRAFIGSEVQNVTPQFEFGQKLRRLARQPQTQLVQLLKVDRQDRLAIGYRNDA